MNAAANTFVWDQDFITGIELVDEQHRALVELFNRLSAAITHGQATDDTAADAVLDELADYARQHFADEEKLMSDAGLFPTYREAHVARHEQFIVQVATLRAAHRGRAGRPTAIVEFLVAWLGYHILGEDQAMARQISRMRAGDTAEQAYEAERTDASPRTSALLKAIGNLYQATIDLNHELAELNRRLETRVAARTAELDLVNDRLREANQRLTTLSRTDGLLDIANRAYLDEVMEVEWQRAMRNTHPIALLLADIDHFKLFNDTYGHIAGDDCLKAVAQAVGVHVHRPTDLLARYGGEELAILLPDTDLAGAQAIARDICAAIAELRIPHGESSYGVVTVSIGVAAFVPERDTTAEVVLSAADGALYVAKDGGRNRVAAAG